MSLVFALLGEFGVQMDQKLAEKLLAARDIPHGSRGLASVPESDLIHPSVDLTLLPEILKSSPLRDGSAGRGPQKKYSESG